MHALYQAFVDTEPSPSEFRNEVDRLQSIEKDIYAIPDLLTIGSVSLNTTPVKDSLHGLAVAWKKKYSTELHEIAKVYNLFILFFFINSSTFHKVLNFLEKDIYLSEKSTSIIEFNWTFIR